MSNSRTARLPLVTIMVVALSAFAYVVCWSLKVIYWDWLKLPIGLGGGLFFLTAIPIVFLVSVPYSIVAVLYGKSRVGRSQNRVAIKFGSIAALVIVIVLAITFPCEVKPYFIGGYFVQRLVRSR
jgi:hypothetical protein